jgi:WhiB family transcriptional regulator, redox-sensing transcriptional regulator
MYGAGTAAIATAAAGFEEVSAAQSVRSGPGPVQASPVQADTVQADTVQAGMVRPGAAAPGTAQSAGMAPAVVPVARSAQLPCTDDPELFFAESPEDVETAKALCVGCAARLTCLSGAMERREPWGVWGGELFLRGEVVPRKRPRGRPRKAEVAA